MLKLSNSPPLNHHVGDFYLFCLLQMNRNLSLVSQLTKLETKLSRETEAIPASSAVSNLNYSEILVERLKFYTTQRDWILGILTAHTPNYKSMCVLN